MELRQTGRGTELVEDVIVPLLLCLQHQRQSSAEIPPGSLQDPSRIPAGSAVIPSQTRPQTHLEDNARLLQQVSPHVGTDDVVVSAEADLDVLPKAAAVVVPRGFGVSNGLMGKRSGTETFMAFFQKQPPAGGAGVLTSMMGLEARTFSSTLVSVEEPPTVAKNLMAYLADTVLPAPDSPLTMIDWFRSSLQKRHRKTLSGKSQVTRLTHLMEPR